MRGKRFAFACPAAVLSVLFFVQRGEAGEAADTDNGRLEVVGDAVAGVVSRWNSLVEDGRRGDWGAVLDSLPANQRSGWISKNSKTNLLRLYFGSEISAERGRIVVYRSSDGTSLARIYAVRRKHLGSDGKGVPTCSRMLFVTMIQQANGPWLVHLFRRDDRPFGIAKSVEGIRLVASPIEQRIKSWEDLRLTIALENTGEFGAVALSPQPTLFLEWNTAFGLVKAEPPSAEKPFSVWYEEVEEMSSPPVSGLFENLWARQQMVTLKPGQRQERLLVLRTLCWKGDSLPEGPSGTFDLFLVYDANLDWDPVAAALPTWSHRVASNTFRVTVERTAP